MLFYIVNIFQSTKWLFKSLPKLYTSGLQPFDLTDHQPSSLGTSQIVRTTFTK